MKCWEMSIPKGGNSDLDLHSQSHGVLVSVGLIGGIPASYFTLYFNITICHVANYTTLNGHIVLFN